MEGWLETQALPGYGRLQGDSRGRLRRWWVHGILRLTAKRLRLLDNDIERLRQQQAAMDRRFGRVPPDTRCTEVDCAGVRAEWIETPASGRRVLLYFHGGGFVFRYPKTHAAMVADFSARAGARGLMVDYRLAPESPYPAAVDDCHAAYRWLLDTGYRPGEIAFGGDSAGGNLVLATLQRIRAVREPTPACAFALSPAVDFTLSCRSLVSNERRDPMFSLAGLTALRSLYAPPERYLDPELSPLFGDFHGLPPLLFQAGEIEMLRDDSVRAAARAHAAGVPVELEIWRRMGHVFQAIPGLPQARAAAARIADFLNLNFTCARATDFGDGTSSSRFAEAPRRDSTTEGRTTATGPVA